MFSCLFPDLDKEKRRRDVYVDRRRYRHHLLEPMFDDGTAGGGATLSPLMFPCFRQQETKKKKKEMARPLAIYVSHHNLCVCVSAYI
jgi:hypothetical protein